MFDRWKKAVKAFRNELTGDGGKWYDALDDFRDKNGNVLNETVYYTCLRILSESVAKMPLKLYKETVKGKEKGTNAAFEVLKFRPNKFLTASQFWAAVMLNVKHTGNGYVWIRRTARKYGAEIADLWIMPSSKVSLYVDNFGLFGGGEELYYKFDDTNGEQYVFKSSDVLHFKNSFSFDGYIGHSVIERLGDTVKGNLSGQRFTKKLYDEGLTSKVALSYTEDLNPKQAQELKEKMSSFVNKMENAATIVPVPYGMTLAPLSLKLTDAQFFELRKYTALQIAAAFGIKPDQINDYSKSSYASSEAQQLAFLVDTLLYDIKNIEEELNYKFLTDKERKDGYFFKFNEKVILRVDSQTQASILASYVNNGIYTPNEARDILDYMKTEGGDKAIVNGNYIPITDVGNQWANNL